MKIYKLSFQRSGDPYREYIVIARSETDAKEYIADDSYDIIYMKILEILEIKRGTIISIK